MSHTSVKTAQAFCPAHVTGFFKAHTAGSSNAARHDGIGSTGAGFSLALGVTTRVTVRDKRYGGSFAPYVITTTTPYDTGAHQMDLSKNVIEKFLGLAKRPNAAVEANHEITIPVGYGLGSSGAVALSLAYALDEALETRMTREQIGSIAHAAEIECKTGLGDVLASYHGGFEIRTAPGAPGVGRVQTIRAQNISVIVICLSPMSTKQFIAEQLTKINGLGEKMVGKLKISRDYGHFQTMSLEFAGYVGVITPRMQKIIKRLHDEQIKCGVALFGETIFCMVETGSKAEKKAQDILKQCGDGIMIQSKIDERGARLVKA